MSDHDFPRWLIDDTSGIADARVFVAHMRTPRFVGELLPDAEADPSRTEPFTNTEIGTQ